MCEGKLIVYQLYQKLKFFNVGETKMHTETTYHSQDKLDTDPDTSKGSNYGQQMEASGPPVSINKKYWASFEHLLLYIQTQHEVVKWFAMLCYSCWVEKRVNC